MLFTVPTAYGVMRLTDWLWMGSFGTSTVVFWLVDLCSQQGRAERDVIVMNGQTPDDGEERIYPGLLVNITNAWQVTANNQSESEANEVFREVFFPRDPGLGRRWQLAKPQFQTCSSQRSFRYQVLVNASVCNITN